MEDFSASIKDQGQPVEQNRICSEALLDTYSQAACCACRPAESKLEQPVAVIDFGPPSTDKAVASALPGGERAEADAGVRPRPFFDPEERQRRREERRERLKNLFEKIQGIDLNSLGGILEKLGQGQELAQHVKNIIQVLQGVEEARFGITRDKKLEVQLTRTEVTKIELNQDNGPIKVKTVDLGKNLKFKIGRDEKGNIKLEDIEDIKINATVPLVGKDISVDLKSATLDKDKDGKPVLKAEITNPLLPGKTIPVVVPISEKRK